MNKTPIVFVCLTLLLTGCSLNPVALTPGSNPADEILEQHVLMEEAREAQVDVLAAKNFEVATGYLSQAQNESNKGEASDDVLETVGYSRAYLQLATQEATFANSRLKEITKARNEAILAGARELPDQLNELDEDLKDLSTRENKVSPLKKASLQSNYFALELEAIKFTNMKKFKKL